MCNLYSNNFPDQMAPVARMHDVERELIQMRWASRRHGRSAGSPLRRPERPASHWHAWLKLQHRCLMPLTSFSEDKDIIGSDAPLFG